jgi:hypothetical protein
MIAAPGLRLEHVGGEQHQQAVGEDVLAVAGDHAQAVAVAVEGDAEVGVEALDHLVRSRRFCGSLGSGWWLGKVPSTSQYSGITSAPIASSTARGDHAGDAVAGSRPPPQRPLQLHVAAIR